jgi:hypothetical protein
MPSRIKQEPLESCLEEITRVTSPRDLFPKDCDPAKIFKRLARIVHPDVAPIGMEARSLAAFKKLNELYTGFTRKEAYNPVVIAGCVVSEPLTKGDICDLYIAESSKDPNVILKIVRGPKDNDLMDRERTALEILWKAKPENFRKYLPEFIQGVKASGRRVNILHNELTYLPLREIVDLHSGKLDFRHIVWMVNRALSILGFAHQSGIVHGAILPCHLLYDPKSHGLKLVDWCYSCTNGQNIPAIVRDYSNNYPPEVKKKRLAGPWTDIYMLMKSIEIISGEVPKRFRGLIQWCVTESPASRPADAWMVQDRWVNLAKEEFGEPKFLTLTMPKN